MLKELCEKPTKDAEQLARNIRAIELVDRMDQTIVRGTELRFIESADEKVSINEKNLAGLLFLGRLIPQFTIDLAL